MPLLLQKHRVPHRSILRDVRPVSQRIADFLDKQNVITSIGFGTGAMMLFGWQAFGAHVDLAGVVLLLYFRWAYKRPFKLALKFPKYANLPDPNNPNKGKPGSGKSEGILYLGNIMDKDETTYMNELWLTNDDARTHILYLGTTGSGKTEGLKALVTNALAWGSGYVYVDGKADTDLWASLYSVARRFGRDDDLLVLNYMTGNTDSSSVSNSMNPFSNGSSSYLANMITNFMPDAGGDNAMWKERAVALMFALMPALTYKRDHQGMLLDIGVVRDHIELQPIIRLSRDPTLPERVTHALNGYLHTLPGFVDAAFDDEGNERPPSPDQPMYDLQVARQQHGYLSMQFTRSLQMMADEYGYIFKAQLADVDVLDVVLNRRILVVLIPALEKSGDEAANLGKIVAASLKGMMGATLGNTVEGAWEMAIGSKQTRSASPFMTVFDEVGYYTAQGMAVMAAQARSLGFSLVFAAQDIPSMEKRVKQEAKSIMANCNLKIYGRIEDPLDTMDFIAKHTQNDYVMETTSMKAPTNTVSSMFMAHPFYDEHAAKIDKRVKFDGDHLKFQREGEIHYTFAELFGYARMFYVDSGKTKALRVHRMLPVPGTTSSTTARERSMQELASRLKDPDWTAASAGSAIAATSEIDAIKKSLADAEAAKLGPMEAGIVAVLNVAALPPKTEAEKAVEKAARAGPTDKGVAIRDGARTPAGKDAAISTRRDSELPPLHEGDQYAIEDVEQAPATAAKTTSAATVAVTKTGAGFAGTDADYGVVTHPEPAEDETSVMDVQLPPEIAALLEQSAKKLNRGLAGSESR
jgi:intracellular multiplication protein IcmO